MKKIAFYLFFLVPFVFNNCQKNDFVQLNEVANTNKTLQCNLINPFDEIGKYHNDCLDAVISKNANSIESAIKELYTFDYSLRKENEPKINYDEFYNFSITVYNITKEKNSFEVLDWFKNISKEKISDKAINILTTLLEISNDNQKDMKTIVCEIEILEQSVLTNKFSDIETELLLGTISIAKNSFKYWAVSDYPTSLSKGRIGNADIEGAIAGFGTGLILGFWGGTAAFPGPGTVIGTISGGLSGLMYGGISSSTLAAIVG